MTTVRSSAGPDTTEAGAGLAAMLTAVVGFSGGFILTKAIALPVAALTFWRLVIAIAVLGGVALGLRMPWPRQRGVLLGAGVAFGAHQLLYAAATKTTSIAVVTLLGALQPLLVAMVSRRVVGERVAPATYGAAVLAICGVGVVVQANLGDPSRSLGGDLLAVVNVFVFTAYYLFAKRARERGAPTLTFTTGMFIVALAVVTPALAFADTLVPVTGAEWGLVALLALGPGNGHLLVTWAHPRVSAALGSLILCAVPLLSSVWARLAFGEPYGWRHALGMALVVTAIQVGRRAEAGRPVDTEKVPRHVDVVTADGPR